MTAYPLRWGYVRYELSQPARASSLTLLAVPSAFKRGPDGPEASSHWGYTKSPNKQG